MKSVLKSILLSAISMAASGRAVALDLVPGVSAQRADAIVAEYAVDMGDARRPMASFGAYTGGRAAIGQAGLLGMAPAAEPGIVAALLAPGQSEPNERTLRASASQEPLPPSAWLSADAREAALRQVKVVRVSSAPPLEGVGLRSLPPAFVEPSRDASGDGPEPGNVAMILAGVGLMVLVARRRGFSVVDS